MDFGNILVPVGGTEADADSIGLACRLVKEGNGGKIVAVHVISMGRTLPLDAEVEAEIGKAEDVLAKAEALVREQGCQIETDLLQAREVAPAIVDEAVERQIDLILLGVNYRTRFGEFCLSEIVPYVLQNAPCQVIIFQQRSV